MKKYLTSILFASFLISHLLCNSYESRVNAAEDTKIALSEVLFSVIDGQFEFIELYNDGNFPVSLKNWQLEDQLGSTKIYTIEDVTLDPGQYIFFTKEQTKLSLNDTGDGVSLKDDQDVLIDNVICDSVQKGKSYIRTLDGWQWASQITPGEPNVADLPEIILILSISEARLLEDDQEITIQGVVTAAPGSISESYFYLQDESSGIQVYSYYKDFPLLKTGDHIKVSGELSTVSNERRLKIQNQDDIEILEAGRLFNPISIDIADISEEYEGRVISVEGEVVDPSGSQFLLNRKDRAVKVIIKNREIVNKPDLKKEMTVSVAGVVSQYRDDYRILPFSNENVKIIKNNTAETVESTAVFESKDLPKAGASGSFGLSIILGILTYLLWKSIHQKVKKIPLELHKILPVILQKEMFLLSLEILAAEKRHLSKV